MGAEKSSGLLPLLDELRRNSEFGDEPLSKCFTRPPPAHDGVQVRYRNAELASELALAEAAPEQIDLELQVAIRVAFGGSFD
jgi:hypothetical protein